MARQPVAPPNLNPSCNELRDGPSSPAAVLRDVALQLRFPRDQLLPKNPEALFQSMPDIEECGGERAEAVLLPAKHAGHSGEGEAVGCQKDVGICHRRRPDASHHEVVSRRYLLNRFRLAEYAGQA